MKWAELVNRIKWAELESGPSLNKNGPSWFLGRVLPIPLFLYTLNKYILITALYCRQTVVHIAPHFFFVFSSYRDIVSTCISLMNVKHVTLCFIFEYGGFSFIQSVINRNDNAFYHYISLCRQLKRGYTCYLCLWIWLSSTCSSYIN